MSARTIVGFFGGSFNPPHVGHVLAAAYALSASEVEKVLVVPCFDHPLGKDLAPFADRAEMCARAFGVLREVEVSTIERDLGATSRTLHTLTVLRDTHPEWSLRLIVGSDILFETDKWYRWNEVIALAPPVVLGRAGFDRPEARVKVLPEVSSRELRARLGRGESVEGFLPREVEAYVHARELYGKRS